MSTVNSSLYPESRGEIGEKKKEGFSKEFFFWAAVLNIDHQVSVFTQAVLLVQWCYFKTMCTQERCKHGWRQRKEGVINRKQT